VDVRPGGAALMFAALGSAFLLNRLNVRTFWPYLLISGPLSWGALFVDGLHPRPRAHSDRAVSAARASTARLLRR
jgi:hypothetical protein